MQTNANIDTLVSVIELNCEYQKMGNQSLNSQGESILRCDENENFIFYSESFNAIAFLWDKDMSWVSGSIVSETFFGIKP